MPIKRHRDSDRKNRQFFEKRKKPVWPMEREEICVDDGHFETCKTLSLLPDLV